MGLAPKTRLILMETLYDIEYAPFVSSSSMTADSLDKFKVGVKMLHKKANLRYVSYRNQPMHLSVLSWDILLTSYSSLLS